MANEILIKDAAATIVWTSSGGDKAITLTSLANNAGRIGASYDRGTPRSRKMRFEVEIDFASSPTKGTTVDLYLITSSDNSKWDGGTAPTDAALGSVDTLPQLVWIGSLVLDDITTPNQIASFEVEVSARYIAPVIYNNGSGQSLTATGTDQIIRMIPIKDEAQ
jgi:hypothetical protein